MRAERSHFVFLPWRAAGPLTPRLPNYTCLSFHYSSLSHPLCWTQQLSSIPSMDVYPKQMEIVFQNSVQYLYTYVHSSIVPHSWKTEANQVFIHEGVWSVCIAEYCAALKEMIGNSDSSYNTEESWGHYGKWHKTVTHTHTNIIWYHFYEVPRVVKFVETESRVVVGLGLWWRGEWEVIAKWGHSFSFIRWKVF